MKNIIALLMVIIVFCTSFLVCFASNGPGYKVKYYDDIFVGINCKILKDQDNYPYYKYNQCRVRLIEGNYDSGWKWSKKFSNVDSSKQQIAIELKQSNNIWYTAYARYGLIG